MQPGGSFLFQDTEEIFTPEDFTEQHQMIAAATRDFVDREVVPHLQEIESQQWDVTLSLMKKAGELGLLSVDIPEEYGGLGLDKTSSMLVAENLGKAGSFTVTMADHTGIGTLPIVFFGTEAQKKRWLPKLAAGECISSYSLTEPNSGSDALSLRTSAALSDDKKHYLLNGSKNFLTNAGLFDICTVFAKVNSEHVTAFILEKNFPGIVLGAEEKKMGIKGSSTRSMILENVKVPVENVLGEIGKGHKIAFNILNIGRFKLGAHTLGGAKAVLTASLQYAKERKQFGHSLSDFGMIKHKLGEMAIRIFAAESMVYRTAGLIDTALAAVEKNAPEAILKGIEEYAVECSILKVYASEMLDFVVDEGVQIFGGYGFIEEYPVARPYRDSRINRIFEGTNEINRLLMTDMLVKRAAKGVLPLFPLAKKTIEEILTGSMTEETAEGPMGDEFQRLRAARKIALYAAGLAIQRYANELEEKQEIAAHISDIILDIYAMESILLRVKKILGHQKETSLVQNIAKAFVNDAFTRIEIHAREILASTAEGDQLRLYMTGLQRLTRRMPENTMALRRRVAEHLTALGRYEV